MATHASFNIRLPQALDLSEFEISMVLASRLYELGKLTAGQGAEMAGITKRTFIELLGKFNVSVFGYTLEDENLDGL